MTLSSVVRDKYVCAAAGATVIIPTGTSVAILDVAHFHRPLQPQTAEGKGLRRCLRRDKAN